jgi:hypothetical protein
MLHITQCTLPNHDPVPFATVDRVKRSSSTMSNSTVNHSIILLDCTHQPLPNLHVHDASYAKCRHDSTDSRGRTLGPIPQHFRAPLTTTCAGPIVQIQSEQMQRRTHQLYRRGCNKLRRARAADISADTLAHVRFETRR